MMPPNLLRKIPSVTDLLESPPLKGLVDRVSHNVVVGGVRSFLDEMRVEVQEKAAEFHVLPIGEMAEKIARRILDGERPTLGPVINATGILLHTGLGRAPLAEEALRQMIATAQGYSNLEIDLASGKRSSRTVVVQGLLKQLTGAEAALVVNNNAAATLLVLTALVAGRKVIVSRGQLVEIGGSYRLPDVMAASGAVLHEVGTTNKTHAKDYEQAIEEDTGALLRVHTSNYRVVGFTSEVDITDLVQLGRQRQLLVVDDIGSGALVDFSKYGCAGEPLARESIAAGADVVLFSGDKLLGGPQCGIIVGRGELLERIARHPMARAVRVDKLTLSALDATLKLYRDEKAAEKSIPLLQLLSTSQENLKNRAERLAPQLGASPAIASAKVQEDVAYLGGGSVPTQKLPTWCVALEPANGNVTTMAKYLRTGQPPVMGRVQQEQLLLDLRSVFPRQDAELVSAVDALKE